MASRPQRSPSSKAPLPRPKRTDPPGLPLPTDPRTWDAWRRRVHGPRWFSPPRPPLDEDRRSAVHFAARAVVREVMLALGLGRFPEKRWQDWLCRRAEAYARVSRRLRPRFTGGRDREWLRVYMRHWLYCGLHRTRSPLAGRLSPDMWCGVSPLASGPAGGETGDRRAAVVKTGRGRLR